MAATVTEPKTPPSITVASMEKPETDTPPPTKKGPRDVGTVSWILIVFSILSSAFLFSLDNTIVADIQPAVVREFSSVEKLSWLPVAFLMGAASTNLLWWVHLLIIASASVVCRYAWIVELT